MVKAIFVCGLLLVAIACSYAAVSGQCPPSSKMTTCSPKCKDDTECYGKKCCPNICNAKSCVPDNLVNAGANVGYKGTSSGAGAYCGNVKCNSFEKCNMDKATNRPKCVRQ